MLMQSYLKIRAASPDIENIFRTQIVHWHKSTLSYPCDIFKEKTKILQKQIETHLTIDGNQIQIFQDVSPAMLRKRICISPRKTKE